MEPISAPSLGKVTVYEAVNETTRELFVSATELPMHVLINLHATLPPDPIRHWKPKHSVHYRSLEFDLPRDDAEKFIAGYSAALGRADWKIHRGA